MGHSNGSPLGPPRGELRAPGLTVVTRATGAVNPHLFPQLARRPGRWRKASGNQPPAWRTGLGASRRYGDTPSPALRRFFGRTSQRLVSERCEMFPQGVWTMLGHPGARGSLGDFSERQQETPIPPGPPPAGWVLPPNGRSKGRPARFGDLGGSAAVFSWRLSQARKGWRIQEGDTWPPRSRHTTN